MSANDDDKPVLEVTEEAWEEDTLKVHPGQLEEALNPPDGASPPDAVLTSDAPSPTEKAADDADDIPVDEQLSDSLRPLLPPAPDHLPNPSRSPLPSIKTAYDTVITDSESPPSLRTFDSFQSTASLASLSMSEHFLRARRVGARFWYAGVFLWTYLVVGELVVGVGLPEALGWSAFAGVVVGAFLHGANRIGPKEMGKSAAISIGAVIFGVFFLATVLGSSRRSEYQAISLVLLLASIGLIFWGKHCSRGGVPETPRTPGSNGLRILLWVLFLSHTAFVAAIFLN